MLHCHRCSECQVDHDKVLQLLRRLKEKMKSQIVQRLNDVHARSGDDTSEDTKDSDVLYIDCVYTVIYDPENPESRVSEEQIEYQHEFTNRCLTNTNHNLLKTPYWYTTIGNPRIKIRTPTVRYIESAPGKQFVTGIYSILKYLGDDAVVQDVLNVYVVDLGDALLGEAVFRSNLMCVNYGTVGSPTYPGLPGFVPYNTGATMVHELGHVMDLPHTFNKTRADCGKNQSDFILNDIAISYAPNFQAKLSYDGAEHKWHAEFDNRYYDCNRLEQQGQLPPYGCTDSELCSTQPLITETFFSFMDYASDRQMTMFSHVQSIIMRQSIVANEFVRAFNGEGKEVNKLIYSKVRGSVPGQRKTPHAKWLVPTLITACIVFVVLVGIFAANDWSALKNETKKLLSS